MVNPSVSFNTLPTTKPSHAPKPTWVERNTELPALSTP